MSETVFKLEQRMDRSEVADQLRSIADGLEKSSMSLSSGNRSTELRPSGTMEFNLEVEKDSPEGEISLEIEVEWYESDEDLEIV